MAGERAGDRAAMLNLAEAAKRWASFAFLFFLVLFASVAIFIVVHELTHLALSDEPQGVCFGLCRGGYAVPSVGLAYARHNSLSAREDIPIVAGLVVSAIVVLGGVKALAGLEFKEKRF